jgi:TonB family protein
MVDGLFPLREYLGGDETGAVFVTEYEGQRAAIKVVEATGRVAEQLLWHWRLASKVSHPHLIPLWKVGRAQLDGTAIAYIVMECADENLGQVLAERPLTPAEAKDMLGPVLEAIECVHRDGFVHGCVTPENITAVNDCLKLSSDSLRRAGEQDEFPALQGAFRAPEVAATGNLSPAGDIWALGVTLVEALTQRRPAWTGTQNELVIPPGVAEPFLTIVHNCLRPQAQERWTAEHISTVLHAPPPAPKKSSRWLYAIPAAVVLIVLAVWLSVSSLDPIRPSVTSSRPPSGSPAVSASAVPVASAPAPVPVVREQAPATPPPELSKPLPSPPERAAPDPVVAANPAAPAPTPDPVAEAPSPSAAPTTSPEVVSQVMPDVLEKARRSIQGKVNVVVKVHADAYGAVRDVTLEPPPVSRYFSGVALKAVRRWKFRTVKDGEVYVAQDWTVRFEFTRADTKVSVERAAP